jgi:hypothetical protein
MPAAPTSLSAVGHSYLASPPTISTSSLPNATVGVAYTAILTATGGVQPYTWSLDAGSLPAGLTLSAKTANTASISGTPTKAGAAAFTVMATDAIQQSAAVHVVMA